MRKKTKEKGKVKGRLDKYRMRNEMETTRSGKDHLGKWKWERRKKQKMEFNRQREL